MYGAGGAGLLTFTAFDDTDVTAGGRGGTAARGGWNYRAARSATGGKQPFVTKYGATTAVADIDGDGVSELIAAVDSTVDGKALVKVFLSDGTEAAGLAFAAFDRSYAAVVAAGDLDGDGVAEIIVGAGPEAGSPAVLRVFGVSGGAVYDTGISALAYQGPGGLMVAAGDLDGDGLAEIITAPGDGSAGDIRIFKADTSGGPGNWSLAVAGGFAAPAGTAAIAAGDLDGDGSSEVVVAVNDDSADVRGAGAEARVLGYRAGGTKVADFGAGASAVVGLASGDTDMDGDAEIVVGTAAEAGAAATIRIYRADGSQVGADIAAQAGAGGIRVSMGELGK